VVVVVEAEEEEHLRLTSPYDPGLGRRRALLRPSVIYYLLQQPQ
jgi:hypothetical protein